MSFCQAREDGVIDGLDGTGDKKTAGIEKPRQRFGMLQEVLNLNRGVVRELRKFPVHGLDDSERVRRPIKEIGVSERDVLGAGIYLLGNIFAHDFLLHYAAA